MCGFLSYLRLSFALLLLAISSNSYADFTVTSTSQNKAVDVGGTCSDITSCIQLFHPFYNSYKTYYPSANIQVYGNRLQMVYTYVWNQETQHLPVQAYFSMTSDCLMTTDVMVCNLQCNSLNSCFDYAFSQCGQYIDDFQYSDPGNFSWSCGVFTVEDLEGG